MIDDVEWIEWKPIRKHDIAAATAAAAAGNAHLCLLKGRYLIQLGSKQGKFFLNNVGHCVLSVVFCDSRLQEESIDVEWERTSNYLGITVRVRGTNSIQVARRKQNSLAKVFFYSGVMMNILKRGAGRRVPVPPLILFLDKPDYKSRQLGKYRYPCTSTKYYASTRIKLARSPEGIFDNKVVPTLTLLLPGTSILFRIENHSTRHLHPFVSVSGKKRIPFNKHTRWTMVSLERINLQFNQNTQGLLQKKSGR